MAAPAITPRPTPTGQPMRDGHKTVIAFEDDSTVVFWEKSVQPPGMDGGEAIPASTMHNLVYRTFGTPALITSTNVTTRVAYDPAVYPEIIALLNDEQAITVHFPNLDTVSFYGRLQSFTPDELVEGTQPEAVVAIAVTNWDPDDNVEQGPVHTVDS